MRTLFQFVIRFTLMVCLVNAAAVAQDKPPAQTRTTSLTITGSASGDRVRFTAPSSVVQIRLEVYDSTARKLFDIEVRGGNVLDWRLQDGQAEPLADETYLCAITVKSLAGKITQRIGSVTIVKGVASMQAVGASQMSARQTEAIGPLEENAALTVMTEGEVQTATVIAHDGTDGQITRGRGALSFRIGDFFAGKAAEQMRLTQEGNLGIGTSEPKLKLDVAGMIGAREGLMFSDGSTLTVNTKGVLTHTTASGNVAPNVAGTGMANRLTKWTDNSGTLGDSAIVDVNGDIGIGIPNPQTGFDYHNAQAPFFTRDFPTNPGNAVSALQLGLSNVGSRNAGVGPSFLFFSENSAGAKSFLGRVSGIWENPTAGVEAGSIFFQVRANSADVNALTERMRITAIGNVGIGTPMPLARLHVEGTSNAAAQVLVRGTAAVNPSIELGSTENGLSVLEGLDIKYMNNIGESIFNNIYTPSTNAFRFQSGGTDRVVIQNAGNVGIGTPNPLYKLEVAAVGNHAVRAQSDCCIGLWGVGNSSTATGVYGSNLGGGVGVYGSVGAGSGIARFTNTGVWGDTPDGDAVLGTSATRTGVVGISNSGTGVIGGSTSGRAITGNSSSSDGIVGSAHVGGKSGVVGLGSSGANGLAGITDSGNGVYGQSTSGAGVAGTTASTDFNAAGVFGEATAGSGQVVGVYGKALGSPVGTGVAGFGSAVGGYFQATAPGGIGLFVEGTGRMNVLQVAGSDVAERFDAVAEAKPGLVVAIDPGNPGQLSISRSAYNRRVAGVISGANKLGAGMVLSDLPGSKNSLPVALSGRVWVYCDATRSPIQPGDLLTTSNTPGHAMKVTNHAKAQGAIIGKAMTSLKSGRGLVLVLVTLQ